MTNILQLLPEVEGEEMIYVQNLLKEMNEEQERQFVAAYRSRRKDPTTILILTLLGFIGIAGIHRFILDRIGTGLLYLFTLGILYIGTIVDLVNYKRITFDYNREHARQIAAMIRGAA